MKTLTFDLPLYSPKVHVIVGEMTGEKLFDHIIKQFGVEVFTLLDEGNESSRGSCNFEDQLVIIWLSSLDEGLVAHECLHATCFILGSSGLTLTSSSEEAYTYLLEWIVNHIVKLKKRKVKK